MSMASNEAVLIEKAVSELYYLQSVTTGISTFLYVHFQRVQFHLKPSISISIQLIPLVTP